MGLPAVARPWAARADFCIRPAAHGLQSNDEAQQAEWDVFRESCEGVWQGMWQTYNFIGDVEDTSTLRVELTGNGMMLRDVVAAEVNRDGRRKLPSAALCWSLPEVARWCGERAKT